MSNPAGRLSLMQLPPICEEQYFFRCLVSAITKTKKIEEYKRNYREKKSKSQNLIGGGTVETEKARARLEVPPEVASE